MLNLLEELWLLALNEKTGKLKQTNLVQALTGALLIELALEKRIYSKGQREVGVTSSEPLNDPVITAGLEKINTSKEVLEVRRWMFALGSLQQKKVQDFVAEGLQERGHIHIVETSALGGILKSKKWVLRDSELRKGIIERMRATGLENKEPTLRTLCLMLLAGQNDLVRITFTPQERSRYQTRLSKLITMLDEPRAEHARSIIVLVLKAIESSRESWNA